MRSDNYALNAVNHIPTYHGFIVIMCRNVVWLWLAASTKACALRVVALRAASWCCAEVFQEKHRQYKGKHRGSFATQFSLVRPACL